MRVLLVIVILCTIKLSFAQSKALTVGSKCPDIELQLLNYKKDKIKLSDIKSDLVILDFWSKYCTDCIKLMPKVDKLDSEFGDKVSIISVAYYNEQKEQVAKFWDNNRFLQPLKLPVAVESKELFECFPTKSVPHIVWLDKNKIVRGITYADYLTEGNIRLLLSGNNPKWLVKKDEVVYDYDSNLLKISNNGAGTNHKVYYTALSNYLPNVGSNYSFTYDTVQNQLRLSCINKSILELYQTSLQKFPALINRKRISLEVKDSSRFMFLASYGYRDVWKSKNYYSYEAIYPSNTHSSVVFDGMKNDLDRFLGLNSRIEKRKVNCLVIAYDKNRKIQNSKMAGAEIKSVEQLVELVDGMVELPVVSEISAEDYSKIVLSPNDWNNLKTLTGALLEYGITLRFEVNEILMFVIAEKEADRK